jgi:alkanesulfonate monooxygenase SsuD/methylene tetrahydromethanopterin reductase-like flavin-dependent oxidoreductase (luciferase family)
MSVDLGLILPAGPSLGQTHQWLADLETNLPALAPHFRSLWMTDHLFWDGEATYEAWTVLSFLAANFPNFEIGPLVLGQNYRNPAILALMAATLQNLSKGRFVMGIGAGWKEDEYHAYGYDFPSPKIRIEQLEETLIILKKLWSEKGKLSFQGKHYRIQDAWFEPKPQPMIPLLVGGGGEKTMRLAVRYADIWNLPDTNVHQYAERVKILERLCDELGRDSRSLRRSWFGRVAIGKTEAEADKYANSRKMKFTVDNALVGTVGQVIEQAAAYRALNCDYFMMDIIGLAEPDILEIVTKELLPELKKL